MSGDYAAALAICQRRFDIFMKHETPNEYAIQHAKSDLTMVYNQLGDGL